MKRVFKWIGIVLGALVLLVIGVYAAATVNLNRHLAKRYDYPAPKLAKKGNLARGKYLVTVRHACVECHGNDLAGGTVVEDPGAGYVYGANITPAVLKDWKDEEIVRVLRHGVSRDGRPLIVMPAAEYTNLCEQDIADIVAYVRSVPPVDKPSRRISAGPAIKIFYLLGKAPFVVTAESVDHDAPYKPQPKEVANAALGRYLYDSMCVGCHMPGRKGGTMNGAPPDWPPAASLHPDALGIWTEADFVKTLKTGVNPTGHVLKFPMIAKYTQHYKDVEVKALWAFLQTPVDGEKPSKDDF